jgi:hypothetical protein
MRMKPNRTRVVCTALLAVALASLGLAGSASAKLTGSFTVFQQCPWTNVAVEQCIHAVTESGEVVLGKKKVTLEKAVTLQGGVTEPDVNAFGKLVAAKNGITLSKAAQNVPGGLLGIVPPESSPPLVKALSKFFFENGLTGVSSTLELAKTASDVLVSQQHFAEQVGVALKMPVKFHLENPFLGKNCFVGSSGSPVTLELTTGTTAPPAPNKPISGNIGELELLEEAEILRSKNNVLADNAWSAPAASGCGGILAFLVNPIINAQIGLPAAKGVNTASLKGTLTQSPRLSVDFNDKANP